MSLLNVAKTDNSIEDEKDSVGGGFGPWESGLYAAEVTMAYLMQSAGGAVGVNLAIKNDDGQEHKEILWIASGNAKGNKNYYETQTGERKYLPGFNTMNSLALLTVGKELGELATDMKMVNVYNPASQKEEPTQVEVIMDLLGQRAIFGIQKQIVDKQVKNQATGKYESNGETRETNEIDKVFRERDRLTTAEIRAQATEAAFYNTWDAKWTGKTRNKATAANDANGGSAGAPRAAAASGGTAKPTKSLFG
ncbi:hypothetical protein [uncultured Marinobacter sp.]|uniref:hypothetical protein n=1 Tax=uncultured Marinobacter sp. TaxID=187379 RepID=UPI002594A57A|nr:hypothetical protein [uncultured Marinobacter sp.]